MTLGYCEEGLLLLDGGDDLVDVLLNASEENNIGIPFQSRLLRVTQPSELVHSVCLFLMEQNILLIIDDYNGFTWANPRMKSLNDSRIGGLLLRKSMDIK